MLDFTKKGRKMRNFTKKSHNHAGFYPKKGRNHAEFY